MAKFFAKISHPREIQNVSWYQIKLAGQQINFMTPVKGWHIVQQNSGCLHCALFLEGSITSDSGKSFKYLALHCMPGNGGQAVIRIEGDDDKHKLYDRIGRCAGSGSNALFEGVPQGVDQNKTPLSGFKEILSTCMTSNSDANAPAMFDMHTPHNAAVTVAFAGPPRQAAQRVCEYGPAHGRQGSLNCLRFMKMMYGKFEIAIPADFTEFADDIANGRTPKRQRRS